MPLMLFWGTIDNWSIPQRLSFLTPTHNATMFPIPSAATISTLVKAQNLGHHLQRRIVFKKQNLQKLGCDFPVSLEVFHVPMKTYSHSLSAEMSADSESFHLRLHSNTSLAYSVKKMLEEIDLRVEKVLASTIGLGRRNQGPNRGRKKQL
ncbi:hypothetical protein DFJ43DRAFT_1158220 [Lentinula guzmanii]|uniref:Uncharacterized protein n=1 Tax=Lentinula guzmanii TaxID=2804957 RepID=A0AA38J6I1_9AGAR|nr:hypothetical protein DFJ43DRAFT_1158220 [Lentinula guzmanii]